MKIAHIVCSIKNLNHDYEHLQWLRMFFLNNEYKLSEDWIHHSLVFRSNKPHFQPAPNFDYMRVATDSIHESNIVVFLMSESSTFTLTMLRYALSVDKEVIVISNQRSILKNVDESKLENIIFMSMLNYRKKFREML